MRAADSDGPAAGVPRVGSGDDGDGDSAHSDAQSVATLPVDEEWDVQ